MQPAIKEAEFNELESIKLENQVCVVLFDESAL